MKNHSFYRPGPALFFLLLGFFSACARLPIESLDLLSAIKAEGERMHKLNVVLVDKLYAQKRAAVDSFIQYEYTPKFMAEFSKRVPDGTDYKKELPGMLTAASRNINKRRDAMQMALESSRIEVMRQLQSDHLVFIKACNELNRLLASHIKVQEQQRALLQQSAGLVKQPIDFNRLEQTLDGFIVDAANWTDHLASFQKDIDTIIKP